MIFEPDFIDLLNKHEVDYMIVGAHALAYHGRSRHTGDLDIFINVDEFIKNKEASGRKKDLGDIASLTKGKK